MMDSLKLLLERAGLNVSTEEIRRLQPYYELYLEALNTLYKVELQDEEVAGTFIPIMEEGDS